MGETLLKVKRFNYTIIKELPIRCLNLKQFKEHRRLIVFYTKGTKCTCCDKKGTRLILGLSNSGSIHWDIYTKDLVPLTVDHIIPKSKGGSNELNNLVWVDFSVNRMKNNLDLETFYSNYSSVLIEYKRLASLESSEVQQSKLNYVLGLN